MLSGLQFLDDVLIMIPVCTRTHMYICVCNGITDREIRSCVEQGACCMADLQRELGVATQCGRCAAHARELLQDAEQRHGSPVEHA